MPKRTDIETILLIGSGPIIIGQACEFDYSGTQACRALRSEGYRVVLVNSNPATIMTDPETADRTYLEPITSEVLEKIIERERPQALLPTMGGQTALNMAATLFESGALGKFDVELIGANYVSIKRAEDREAFKRVVRQAGLQHPKGGVATSRQEALAIVAETGFPAVIRPSFTLGGTGGSVAYNREEFERLVEAGLSASPIRQVLVEESVLGWKEYELEVMRDCKDNVVIICSIENVDPMGIHTGDSITVAPAQTLTDREYQRMRDAAIAIIRGVGVDTGGSNIQFAVNPKDGEMRVIEMNPRVSRSSALASKATGYPIAKIAAKLSVGLTLDEIQNDITRTTPASFEPTIDYVVVKIPRFPFEKFPQADTSLTLQMKSVGEVMAIGRTFKEALLKALRSLEVGRESLEPQVTSLEEEGNSLRDKLTRPTYNRLCQMADGLRLGLSIQEITELTHIDPWFVDQIRQIIEVEREIQAATPPLSSSMLLRAKREGLSDRSLARLTGQAEVVVRRQRFQESILPVYKRVDTCGAEFEAHTPYLYSTYEKECEAQPTGREKVMILGSGPNRIGQGVEFDYCCVHAVQSLREEGYETIMVNCNPETVSTDYDTSDRLYFEPLTLEDVLHIVVKERPLGVVLQFGGQTPLKLALALEREGVKILGTSSDAIDRAEDRERFSALLNQLGLKQADSGVARSFPDALQIAERIGYPVMVRPSYVLGGRAMEVVYDSKGLEEYMLKAAWTSPDHPTLIDRYLEDAIEIDVDAVSDGTDVVVGGILEHIEEAGIHSGDSACSLPPYSLDAAILERITAQTIALAKELGVVGLMNVQFAYKGGELFVLEVNPRGSRTVPFVSKATGVPLAKVAMRAIVGKNLREQGLSGGRIEVPHFAVKEAVFPFRRLQVDPILGPEMKSTGEVMGLGEDFGWAFAKAEAGADNPLPRTGRVFVSVKDKDKPLILPLVQQLLKGGFQIVATRGTAEYLKQNGLFHIEQVNKVKEGRPHIVDAVKNGEIALVFNTVGDKLSQRDSYAIRQAVLEQGVPYFTTVAGARAALRGIEAQMSHGVAVKALQDYHRSKSSRPGG